MRTIELVHQKSQAAFSLAVYLNRTALTVDLISAIIATVAIFGAPDLLKPWFPFAVLALAVVAMFLRCYSAQVRSFAQEARRLSIRALAFEREIPTLVASDIESQSPLLADRIAKRGRIQSVADYYQPANSPGERRLVELYAHSAFYTWHVLRSYAKAMAVLGVLSVIVVLSIAYYLVISPVDPSAAAAVAARNGVLEALCTVGLAVLSPRTMETALNAWQSSTVIKNFEQSLHSVNSSELRDHLNNYEVEIAIAPSVPSALYWLMRTRIMRLWDNRRPAYSCPGSA